jgi:hypothetical protein
LWQAEGRGEYNVFLVAICKPARDSLFQQANNKEAASGSKEKQGLQIFHIKGHHRNMGSYYALIGLAQKRHASLPVCTALGGCR